MLLTKLGIRIKITESMKTIIEHKFKFLEKYLNDETEVKFTCFKENSMIFNLSLKFVYRKKLIKASVSDEDFYVALDKLADKIKSQLIKCKEISTLKSTKKEVHQLNNNNINDVEHYSNQIVKRKEFQMKPLLEEEAILQMNQLNHNSFMFLNAKTNTMCLLYRRKDGKFGLIETID